jgi:hypothetical protein
MMASVWITEQPADDAGPTFGTPADVIERCRSGSFPESQQDRLVRHEEQAAEVEREARREQRENADVLAARRGEGIAGWSDVVARAHVVSAMQDAQDRQRDKALAELAAQVAEPSIRSTQRWSMERRQRERDAAKSPEQREIEALRRDLISMRAVLSANGIKPPSLSRV